MDVMCFKYDKPLLIFFRLYICISIVLLSQEVSYLQESQLFRTHHSCIIYSSDYQWKRVCEILHQLIHVYMVSEQTNQSPAFYSQPTVKQIRIIKSTMSNNNNTPAINDIPVINTPPSTLIKTNAYTTHHSNSPSIVLVTPLLSRDNYGPWSRAVTMALRAKSKLGFVDGSLPILTEKEDISNWE